MEHSVGILKSSVAVEDGLSVRICLYGGIKSIVYQWIVIAVPNLIGDNAPVIEIENGTEIDFVYLNAFIPLELRNIRQPFLVRLLRMEVPVENVLCQVLRILSISCTTMVCILDGGLYVTAAADP